MESYKNIPITWSSRMTKCKGKLCDGVFKLSSVLLTDKTAPEFMDGLLAKKTVAPKKTTSLLEEGRVLNVGGSSWTVGKYLASGGFGAINTIASGGKTAVVKSEPRSSGPLFTEVAFYLRMQKHPNVCEYLHWGVEKDVRFVILRTYKTALDHLDTAKIFSDMLSALEHIHTRVYAHGDIKPGNILATETDAVLADFGSVTLFKPPKGSHVDDERRPELVGNGTWEYTSIDAMAGRRLSRRADMESLGYTMMKIATGCLPWEDCRKTAEAKKAVFRDSPTHYKDYFKSVLALKHDEVPNYKVVPVL